VRSWVLAWVANAVSIGFAVSFWLVQPVRGVGVLIAGYSGFKIAFVLWLLQGAWAIGRPGATLLSMRTVVTAAAAFGFLCGLFVPSISVLGVVQHVTMAVLLIGGVLALGREWRVIAWLSTGLCLRGALALAEAATYWVDLNPSGAFTPGLREQAGWLRSAARWPCPSARSVSWRSPIATCCSPRRTCAAWRTEIR
jgi:hypothetical protein